MFSQERLEADNIHLLVENEEMRRKKQAVKAFVRKYEWAGMSLEKRKDRSNIFRVGVCPSCGQGQEEGHGQGCEIAKLLEEGEEEA